MENRGKYLSTKNKKGVEEKERKGRRKELGWRGGDQGRRKKKFLRSDKAVFSSVALVLAENVEDEFKL